tara:strand:- start:483 stop:1559 length:1077 start_codon:yes stop_codon:yes gene_type:complete
MAEIYKQFTPDDIVPGDAQVISQPVWSENMNPFSQSFGGSTGIGFFTSSAQVSQSGNYYVDVYQRDPQSTSDSSNSAIQFALAYGNRLGSGSYGDPNTVGQNENDTPTRAIYSQYANELLPATTRTFTFGSDTPDDIIVFNIARSRFRQKVDPGNWELRIASGGAGTPNDGLTSYMSFVDNSGEEETPTLNEAGRVISILSGSGAVTASNTVYGLFYPDWGCLVFNANRLATETGMPFDSQSAAVLSAAVTQPQNSVTASMYVSASTYFAARSEERITSTHYFIRVTNRAFNYSNNPTFVTGSTGTFLHASMLRNPSVYLTTIGMYDDQNRLVAVAKLSKPLLKSFNREALIKVKLDY